jgi:sirohydrochlorin ferrochelatase
MPCILLVDNGSTRANAKLQLRRVSAALTARVGQQVHPVSLQHSHKIDPALLDNEPAQIFHDFLEKHITDGTREFIVLPLFFGRSRALTSFIPEQLQALEEKFGEFDLRVAHTLYPLPQREPVLVDILHDHILQTASQHDMDIKNVVLVEHGSPLPEVNQVRRSLAEELHNILEPDGNITVGQAVMERRKGKEYDFNGDLLEDWLDARVAEGINNVVVAMLFLLPGRHAGEGGDIAEICENAMARHAGLKVFITPLVGEHPALLDILENRLSEVMDNW